VKSVAVYDLAKVLEAVAVRGGAGLSGGHTMIKRAIPTQFR
jgi:hypothetical protein